MGFSERNGLMIPDSLIEEKAFDSTTYSIVNNNFIETESAVNDPFKNNYLIHRGVSLLSQCIASVPLDIYRGNKVIPSPNHEVYRLLIKPSEDVCRFELFEKLAMFLFVEGESFLFLNMNNHNFIKEIYVLNPVYMRHEKDEDTGQIKSWVFNSKIPMPKNQVIHFKLPNTKGLRGLSPIEAITREVLTDENASKYSKAYFKNNADSGGYLKVDAKAEIQPDQMRTVLKEWNSIHRGPDNAYKIGGLLGGMEYVSSAATHTEMQYTAIRDSIRDRILTALGLSKSVMGITDDVNRASAREGMRALWELTLKPHLVRIQQKLDAELFVPYFPGCTCKFDLSDVEELKKDMNKTLDIALKFRDMGYTRNQVNERLNMDMPPTSDEDDLLKKILVRRADLSKLTEVKPKVEADPKKDEPKLPKPKPEPKKDLSPQKKEFRSKLKAYFFKQRSAILKGKDTFDDEKLISIAEQFDLDSSIVSMNLCIKNELELNKLVCSKNKSTDEVLNNGIRKIYNDVEKKLKEVVEELYNE